jgi:sterol-4alpha-carboxylate 3-dehydrogenase (decarboxylating)
MSTDKRTSSLKGKTCVVIGGCGFLGQRLVEDLLEIGAKVVAFDIRKTFENSKVTFVIGDINDAEKLRSGIKDAYVVFNCASPPPELDNRDLFYSVNLKGTQNIIKVCQECGVQRLVLTSTCSVVYEGVDIKNAPETTPYAKKPIDYYTETKILQEKEVLKANNGTTFLTVAIRPHGIFGPKDVAVSTMIVQAKKGLKFVLGDGKNVVDWTHVKNVVHAHILAAEQLIPSSPICGQAFNITNDEPIPFWTFYKHVAEGMGYKAPTIHIPYSLALYLSMIVNFFLILLRPIVHVKTTFIPSRIALAGTYHYYDCSKAKKQLGYKPVLNLTEGIDDTLQYYKQLDQKKK